MSTIIETTISLKCDKCNDVYGTSASKANQGRRWVRSDAKAHGWKLGKKRDLCPSCAAELSKAVKSLLATG